MGTGAHSQTCYYRALEDCYTRFADKLDKLSGLQTQHQQTFQLASNNGSSSPTKRKIPPQSPTGQANGTIPQSPANPAVDEPFSALSPDYFVFHAPYNKLVQKSYARLFLLDARRQHERLAVKNDETARESEKKDATSAESPLAPWLTKPIEETYTDRALDGVLKKLSSTSYKQRLSDSSHLSKLVGNTYAASVFMGLASLIDKVGGRGELTPGKTAVVFSYGSGAMATMYRLHVRDTTQSRFTIDKMISSLSLETRLLRREEVHPQELDYALETRARMHRAGAPYSPVYPTVGRMFPGTYYLNGIDSKWRRTYSRIPLNDKMIHRNDSPNLAPPIVLRLAKREEVSIPVTGKLSVLAETNNNTDSLGKESLVMKRVACVVSGIAAGLPGKDGPVFREDNLERLIRGDQCIGPISGTTKMSLLDKNVVQLKKNPNGTTERFSVSSQSDHIQIAAQLGSLDLCASYGVAAGLAQTMDYAAQVAVAAGLEALKSAKLVSGKSADSSEWKLEDKYRDTTGVVYASSFPAMDAAVGEVMRFLQSKTVGAAPMERLVEGLRNRLLRASSDRQLSDDDETALARLLARAQETEGEYQNSKPYEFDRKFLFKVLVLGNSQLAQMCGCRGPNTQTNAACAGTTQAIAMAQDMLISGRAERVVVVAGDNASGETLLPWLGSGFRALGAASTKSVVEDAALPFDLRRSGMILGAGGIGMVIETEMSLIERLGKSAIKARLLATQYSNSAFHGAALDRKHIASELKRFFNDIDLIHGISKAEIATHGVYFSHETCTHASSASSCSGNEIAALREALGDQLLSKLLILNTKGFTGHPMGVSFEDVAAVEVLLKQTVPPVPNYKVKDDYLGELNISKGGPYACRYALRFAAGFGSQVAFALYSTGQDN